MVKRRAAEETAEPFAGETQAGPKGSATDIFAEQIAEREKEAAQRSAIQAERDRRAEQVARVGDRSARRHENLNAIAVDEKAGIRLEREEKRMPGQTGTRLLITFAKGKLPSKDEAALLEQEGFKEDHQIGSWTAPNTAAQLQLAKHAFNGVLELRGVEPRIAVPSR